MDLIQNKLKIEIATGWKKPNPSFVTILISLLKEIIY